LEARKRLLTHLQQCSSKIAGDASFGVAVLAVLHGTKSFMHGGFMLRRDVSRALLAASAATALGAQTAAAQTGCNAPCYAVTASEIANGVTPVNLAYQQGDVRRYGADPSGAADSTTAIQNALNVGGDVYLPVGTYQISSSLTNSVSGRRIYGAGASASILMPVGAIVTLINSAPLSIVLMDNFGISGGSATLDGITQASGTTMCASRFQDLTVTVGGRAFYFPEEFDTQLENCQGSSYNNNVFELQGGNSTSLKGCYAHQVPAGMYGYRIYCGAHLDSCTGIDTPAGGDWGLFGAAIAKGDSGNYQFAVTLTNCDVEDFNNYGIRLRGNGYAKITGGAIQAKATGTYQAEIYIEYTHQLVLVENVYLYPKGATRAKQAPIYADQGSYVMVMGNTFPAQYDCAGTLNTLPLLRPSSPASKHLALNINSLDVSDLYNRYAGTVVLASGAAVVSFGVPRFDTNYMVLVTGNQSEILTVTNKTTSGFTITSSNAASAAAVDWMSVRVGT
jgi:Pectate lyase superfamily protein